MSNVPTYPVVPAFPAGYSPLPADMDNWIQAPFTWLTSKVVFRAQHQGTLSLAGGSFTHLVYDTILDDPYSGWSSGAGTWTPPIQGTGWYEVTVTGFTTSVASTTSQVAPAVYLDGAEYMQGAGWSVDGHATGTTMAVILALAGGLDNISGYLYTTHSASTTATAGQYPTMEIVWVSQ